MKLLTVIAVASLSLLCACVPKVTMDVETRDAGGNLIERGTMDASSTARKFRVDSNGTIILTVSGQDSAGLQDLSFTGGFSCNKPGQVQQGTLFGRDANLPGSHPSSESFTSTIQVQCSGGTYTGSVHGCGTNAKNSSSCTQDATF
jgi:hypothetical protein